MKKSTKMVKKLLALFLVVLMSIDSFAAIVSDNDGSAFVTKAEFEAMKSDFAGQIDGYNESIDGKINGAIAAYLAGLKLNTITEENQLCYTNEGILSPRDAYQDLNFKMGVLDWDINWYVISMRGNGKATITGKSGTSEDYKFGELAIDKIELKDGKYYGKWCGYITDFQKLVQTGFHRATGEAWDKASATTFKMQTNCVGFNNFDNVRLNTDTTARPMFTYSLPFNNSAGDAWGSWTFNATHNTATRTITKTTNKNIIITKKSVYGKRFSRIDDVYDFNNCLDTTNFSTNPFKKINTGTSANPGQIWSSCKLEYWGGGGVPVRQNVSGTFVSGQNGNNGNYYFYKGNAYGTKPTGWDDYAAFLPYFGFCNYFTDYNQLWTDLYDGYIEDMKAKQADLNVLKMNDGTEHLALNAGAPIVYAKSEDIVDLVVEFVDKTKNYDLWLKVGSFSYDKNPPDEPNLLSKDQIKINNLNATDGLASKSIRIPSGKANVEIEMPTSGYIFMKWQISNSDVVGGGTYLPTARVRISR